MTMARLEQLKVSVKLVLTVVLVVCSSHLLVDGEVVEWVQRRHSEDFYKYTSSSSHERCDGQTNATFLVADGQCVDNQELFTGCTHAIVPSSQLVAIIANINSNVSILHLVGNDSNSGGIFHFNETEQPVNSTFCHIASLEVFRGWEQVVQISHNGFSFIDNGTVKIDTASLDYSLDDFLGELYRINISCPGSSGLPEGGCVFFKAIGSQSNVTHAKFNCTVPGTLMDYDDKCHTSLNTPSSPTTANSKKTSEVIAMSEDVMSTMVPSTDPNDEESNGHSFTPENGDFLTTVLAVLGSGIIIVILAIVALSFVLGRKLMKEKRRSFTMEMTERYENPYRISEDDYPEQQQGQLHQQDDNTAQLVQETVFSATSNRENDISDASMIHGNVYSTVPQAAVEDDYLESVQIYNNVAPIVAHTHEEEAADERRYANVSRSLNTSTGDLTVDQGGTAVSHAINHIDDPNHIYSVPDMKKKREERQRKREQMENRERLVDTAEAFSLSSPPNFNVREKHVQSDSVSKETDSEYENISRSMELNPNRATTESDDFTPNQSQCGAEVSVSNSDDSVPIYSVPDMKKKREERQKKREQIENQERSADKAEVFTMSSPPNFNMKGMLMSAHSADAKEQTYCNINHAKPADLLEEAGDYQNVLRGELRDDHNLDQSPYDNPASLNLVPKRSKDKDQ